MFCVSISPLSVLCVMVFLVIKSDSFAQPAKSKHLPNLLSASSSLRERKPNIILILTDDQDVELGSLNYMPKTLKAIRYQGAEFRHAYVTTPMCCPSRSSLLTGMYVHNHNVYTNNDNCSNTQWQATYETRSFATYLSNAGYRTGYFGKYLNKYNGSYIPPGWREWGGLIMNSKYYNYSINMNGKKIKHGFDYYKDYYPDLIANDSIAFLRQSKKNSAHKPVMLTMSFPSPHGPEDSAPQYSNLFFNVTSHHIPSYDYAPNPDKQWILQVTNKMQPIHKEFTDLLMTKRLQTLQSVDSAVQRVVEELEDLKELENTYIIYTSDHGYHLGQFGLVKGKSFPFEFDVRVPFLVRGPGVEAGTVVDEIVLNIDLAPTFLDMAGVEVPPHMDGRSVLPLFLTGNRKRLKWPDTFLIESSGRRETPFLDAKLRRLTTTPATTASEYQSTPNGQTNVSTSSISFESTTLPHTSAPKINESEEDHSTTERIDDVDLESDEGARSDEELDLERIESEQADQNVPILDRNQMQIDNSVLPGFISTKIERLSKECSQADMQKPCSENQKWYCENENGRWRKHKCKSIVIPHTLIDNRSFKKCTCHTSHGDIIRKIPVENINKRYSRLNGRFKRRGPSNQASEDREVKELHLLLRNKRASISRVDHMLNNVRDQIRELEVSTTSAIENLESVNFETNTIHGVKTGCSIIDNGRVNCPNQIYHDRKVWQKSRHEVNNEIHSLKNKLEQLKEIRKHLKYFRPNEDYNALNSTSNKNLNWPRRNSFHVHHGNASQFYKSHRKKHRRPFHYDTNQGRHRQIQNNTFLNNATVDLDIQNVNSSKLNSNNTAEMSNIIHHRHTHFQQELTTQGYEIKKPSEASPRSFITTRYPKARISDVIPFPLKNCHCEHIDDIKPLDEREIARESKRKLKEEKLKKKQRRQKKKDHMEKECSAERMNCFHQDNDHWKTAPLWTNGPFCFCMNANNNTYSCIRTINSTHNFLYCEFTTGLVTFYNLRIDPFELENRADQLKLEEKTYLHTLLHNLIACKGKSCTVTNPSVSSRNRTNTSTLSVSPHHRYRKKKLPTHLRNKSLDAAKMLNVSIQTTQDLSNLNESNFTEIDGRIVTSNGSTAETLSEN